MEDTELLEVLDDSPVLAPRVARLRLTMVQWLFVLLPLGFLLFMAWTHRWIADDAMIDVRVVNNILAGHGPVFNVGERVEAYTNPLWVLALVIVHGLVAGVSIEWFAVFLGIAFTALGTLAGTLATVRFANRRAVGLVLPLGALLVSVVDSMWDFTTSGLETGMIFGWIGFCWWLIVRQLHEPRRLAVIAVVIGLGPEIRPDMGFLAVGFLAALMLIAFQEFAGSVKQAFRKASGYVAAFLVAPLIFEAFRIAYFGLLLPNTALAKSGFSLDLHQGLIYLGDFLEPNLLWVPFIIIAFVVRSRTKEWIAQGARLEVLIFAVVSAGAIADGAYVVYIGGDFMHARMLLPAFFCLSMLTWLDARRIARGPRPLLQLLPLIAILGWSVASAGFLRYTVPGIGDFGIANERSFYIVHSGSSHPVNLSSYSRTILFRQGTRDAQLSSVFSENGKKVFVTGEDVGERFGSRNVAVTTRLPESVFVAVQNIGIWGAAAGSKVYIFDELSLANPIGSHFSNVPQYRPGHSDYIPATWMLARFGSRREVDALGVDDAANVKLERSVLNCQPLSGYLHAIDAPFSLRQVFDNVEHAFTWTSMRFSSSPAAAHAQLCKRQE